MFFEHTLTIPANTAKASPVEEEAPLAPGVVTLVAVQFPRGCVGLVHVQIWRHEHQVWPVNLDGDISAENDTPSWPEEYVLDEVPLGFTLRGWNLDDSFPHTITFRFAMAGLEAFQEALAGPGLLRRVAQFLGMGG